MKLQERIGQLRAVNACRDASFIGDFETALAGISAMNDAASIVPLLDSLEDEPPADELMFSIIHTIERHPDEVYVRELLHGTAALLRRSRRWSRVLYMRVLNSPSSRTILAGILRGQAPETQGAVKEILDEIEKTRPELAAKVQQVLDERELDVS